MYIYIYIYIYIGIAAGAVSGLCGAAGALLLSTANSYTYTPIISISISNV